MKTRIITIAAAAALFIVAPLAASRAQATGVTCTDGTMSAAVGKGACSGHGGVKARAMTKPAARMAKTEAKMDKAEAKAEAKTDKAETKADARMAKAEAKSDKSEMKMAGKSAKAGDKDPKNATASCKDGTYSHAATHTGACSGHGGVLKFFK